MRHISREGPKREAVIGAPLVEPTTCDFAVHQGDVGLALLVRELRPGRMTHLDHKGQYEKRRDCDQSFPCKMGADGEITVVYPV